METLGRLDRDGKLGGGSAGGRAKLGGRLTLRGLRKTYGSTVAVRDVSLEVRAGDFCALLGPSGSGKSTLLMMIAGFIAPTAGEVCIDDVAIGGVPPHRRNIGVVFQSYALFPHLSVWENLAFPLEVRKQTRSEIDRRVHALLELVGLSGADAKRPAELSGGEQQRIAVARALIFEPRLLLMDEPLGALDKKLRSRMQVELRELHRNLGITILYVTHDQDEALAMASHVAVLNAGSLEQVGEPREVYERPRSWFVADFLGDSNSWFGTAVERSATAEHILLDGGASIDIQTDRGPRESGSRLVLVCRPESIICLDLHQQDSYRWRGRVWDSVFAGNTTTYFVDVDGVGKVMATVRSDRHQRTYQIGELVGLSWADEDCKVFPLEA